MMVVVPTANDVELTYGRSGADWLFTLADGGRHRLCIFWRFRGDVRHAAEVPVFGPSAEAAAMPPPTPRPRASETSNTSKPITIPGLRIASNRTASPRRIGGSIPDRHRR